MAYDTATTESVLLKYLEMYGNSETSRPLTIPDLMANLREAEKSARNLQIYGFSSQEEVATHQVLSDVSDLQEFGFLNRDEQTAQLSLTEWGKLCANIFDLPPALRETFELILCPHGHAVDRGDHKALRAACVAF
jgi:hypothetical protein